MQHARSTQLSKNVSTQAEDGITMNQDGLRVTTTFRRLGGKESSAGAS
jgi:hypothetical protein